MIATMYMLGSTEYCLSQNLEHIRIYVEQKEDMIDKGVHKNCQFQNSHPVMAQNFLLNFEGHLFMFSVILDKGT